MSNRKPFKILDCTLRDGGYYTDWDFEVNLVNDYLENFNALPVDYLEIGYRSQPLDGYFGQFFYCPLNTLTDVKRKSQKKLAIILNEKSVKLVDLDSLLDPCVGLIDMVRLAIDPANLMRAIKLAEGIKAKGFEVGFNVMYMSKWQEFPVLLEGLKEISGIANYFYMVDSFGGVYPDQVKSTIEMVRSHTDVPLGFHGHNNLELGLINTLTAISEGVDIVDATITGMGRGAGNLKMELLLTALSAQNVIDIDFNALGNVVGKFEELRESFGWGTSLPYMVSGANSLPQKDVMEWVTKRFYSFNSIIRTLDNQSQGVDDNLKLPDFKATQTYTKALVVGGGPNAQSHSNAIRQFLSSNENIAIIHASSRNAAPLAQIKREQYHCLIGNEGHRLEKMFEKVSDSESVCILPPYPRKMGTYVPELMLNSSYQLTSIQFTDTFKDSPTALAIQTALNLGCSEIMFAGYDGYSGEEIGPKERDLFQENEYIFNALRKEGVEGVSITPTGYGNLKHASVYEYLT